MTSVQLFHSALELQQQRCKLFHDWTQSLQEVALGTCTLERIHKLINTELIPQFQHINTSMRALQQKTNSIMEISNQSLSNNKQNNKQDDQQAQMLSNWIDDIQRAEQEHYAITVQLNVSVLEHLKSSVDISINSSEKESLETNYVNDVHVQNVCALNKIFAPRILEHLHFIRFNTDDDEELSMDKFSDNHESDNENKAEEHDNMNAKSSYDYKKIYACRKELCGKFTRTVQSLLQRQKESETKIVELVDTLQNEISDL